MFLANYLSSHMRQQKMEEVIYSVRIRNPQSGTTFVKFGYTNNIERRLTQLRKGIHSNFELIELRLFKHKTKNIGYLSYEKRLHEKFISERQYVDRSIMSVGYTECYESGYRQMIEHYLTKEGFICVYDEIEHIKQLEEQKHAMFVW